MCLFCFRYSASAPPVKAISCGKHKKGFQCSKLTRRDINHFHRLFNKIPSKLYQDSIILKYTSASMPKRSRATKQNSSRKTLTINYFIKRGIMKRGEPNKIQVCQNTFWAVLNLKKTRVQNICRKHFKGDTLKDNRGGDTRSKAYELTRKCIANFMNTIKTLESHYCTCLLYTSRCV